MEKLLDMFRNLPVRAHDRVFRPALRAGHKTFMQEAADTINVDDEAAERQDRKPMRELMTTRAMKRKRGRVGFRTFWKAAEKLKGVSKSTGKSFFRPAAVEYGHPRAPAHPFQGEAFMFSFQPVVNQIGRETVAGIEREAAKMGR